MKDLNLDFNQPHIFEAEVTLKNGNNYDILLKNRITAADIEDEVDLINDRLAKKGFCTFCDENGTYYIFNTQEIASLTLKKFESNPHVTEKDDDKK